MSMLLCANTYRKKFFFLKYHIVLLVFLFTPSHLIAEEYRLIFVNPRQINLIEVSSIKDEGNGIYEAWLISVREKNSFLDGKVSQGKLHTEINCKERTERVLTSVFYGFDGVELTRKEKPEKAAHPWVPDTVSATVGEFVCEPKSRDTKYSFGDMPLKDIIKSIYDGPWPLNK